MDQLSALLAPVNNNINVAACYNIMIMMMLMTAIDWCVISRQMTCSTVQLYLLALPPASCYCIGLVRLSLSLCVCLYV